VTCISSSKVPGGGGGILRHMASKSIPATVSGAGEQIFRDSFVLGIDTSAPTPTPSATWVSKVSGASVSTPENQRFPGGSGSFWKFRLWQSLAVLPMSGRDI
jgi:hypothetical protein